MRGLRYTGSFMFHLLEKRIADAFASRVQSLYGISVPVQTEQPKQSSFGEIAVPAAFQLARQLKKAPKAIAAELAAGFSSRMNPAPSPIDVPSRPLSKGRQYPAESRPSEPKP